MERTIKNYDELATSPLRRDALDILEAGYQSILTENIIHQTLTRKEDTIRIKDSEFRIGDFERIFFVGIGKCAVDAGLAVEEILGEKITAGIVIDVKSGTFKKIRSRVGTHPYPSEQNVSVAKEIVAMLSNLTERDLVIAVISGGGSSLFSLPHNLTPETLSSITKAMMNKGAPIRELNIVRKHLSEVQGGFLAKIMYPAKVAALLFSDVPGDEIETIASGPTVLDTSTKEEAEALFMKYDLLKTCRLMSLQALETPKDEKYFATIKNILVVSNIVALSAMKEKAETLGYSSSIESANIQGEAREFGKKMAEIEVQHKKCYLFGGETTVTVIGKNGSGGRNQEVILGALPFIRDGVAVISAASDGWDNSETAGALGDKVLFEEGKGRGLDPQKFLAENNSFTFFSQIGGHIMTGRTGANVADFYFVLMG